MPSTVDAAAHEGDPSALSDDWMADIDADDGDDAEEKGATEDVDCPTRDHAPTADDDAALQSGERDDDESIADIGVTEKEDDWTMDDVEMSSGHDAAAASVAVASSSNDAAPEENYAGVEEDANHEADEAPALGDHGAAWEGKTAGENVEDEAFLPSAEPSAPGSTRPAPSRNQKQDDFVKKGARARALLATALRAVVDGFASNATIGGGGSDAGEGEKDGGGSADGEGGSTQTWNARTDFAHVQELAQDRAEECMALKRKLQEAQSQIEALKSDHAASEETNAQLRAKVDRTLEALQIAGTNAANARAEADASNARAASLSTQLDELQSVIDETKRGMEAVRREHDEVSRAARSVEGRLIQVEGELIRAARARKDAVEARDLLQDRATKAETLARELQERADDYRDEVRMLKKDLLEVEELERVRSDRAKRIEEEFQEARGSLLEATSAAAEAESTVTSLRSVVEELRKENEGLHERMEERRDHAEKERAKHNEALTLAEREAQKWKISTEEANEEARKLTVDKTSAEKQVEALKMRMANMERRLHDAGKQFGARTEKTPAASSAITPHSSDNLGFINSLGAKDAPLVSDESKKRKFVSELPQRESTKVAAAPNSSSRQLTYSYQKENKPNSNTQDRGGQKRKVVRSNKCCLCDKEGGMILSCQCDAYCGMRAHAICIGKFRSGKKDSKRTILCGEASA